MAGGIILLGNSCLVRPVRLSHPSKASHACMSHDPFQSNSYNLSLSFWHLVRNSPSPPAHVPPHAFTAKKALATDVPPKSPFPFFAN